MTSSLRLFPLAPLLNPAHSFFGERESLRERKIYYIGPTVINIHTGCTTTFHVGSNSNMKTKQHVYTVLPFFKVCCSCLRERERKRERERVSERERALIACWPPWQGPLQNRLLPGTCQCCEYCHKYQEFLFAFKSYLLTESPSQSCASPPPPHTPSPLHHGRDSLRRPAVIEEIVLDELSDCLNCWVTRF